MSIAGNTAAAAADDRPPSRLFRNLAAKTAAIPMMLVVIVGFVGCTIWTVVYSFTDSVALPNGPWIGFAQYERLFASRLWSVSVRNIAIYGVLTLAFTLVVGFILAALMDQKIRFENTFRTIFLYPFALSFIVTGLVWQWMLNPAFGLQQSVRDLGWESFTFDWIANRRMVVYTLVIAGVWQGTGLVMALMLAGLRGIDNEIWKASRVDGIPAWRTYIFIIIPMMRPVIVTTLVLVAAAIVRTYDLVVAMTGGGPGISSTFPAVYVYQFMFVRNLGQGLAASAVMLVTVAIIMIPWAYLEYGRKKQ